MFSKIGIYLKYFMKEYPLLHVEFTLEETALTSSGQSMLQSSKWDRDFLHVLIDESPYYFKPHWHSGSASHLADPCKCGYAILIGWGQAMGPQCGVGMLS